MSVAVGGEHYNGNDPLESNKLLDVLQLLLEIIDAICD